MLLLAGIPCAESAAAMSDGDTVVIDFGGIASTTAHYNDVSYPGSASWTASNSVRLSDGADTGVSLEVVMVGGSDRNNTGFNGERSLMKTS